MEQILAIVIGAVFTAVLGVCLWLFKRTMDRINKDIEEIKELLSNHITGTTKEIKRLSEGQMELKVKIAEGQAELKVKITEGLAKLEGKIAELSKEKNKKE